MVITGAVLPLNSHTFLGLNQETYHRLRQATQTVPPHRVWIAACDDLPLQRQIAAALEEALIAELETRPNWVSPSTQLILAGSEPDVVRQILSWRQQQRGRSPYLQILGVERLTNQPSDQQYRFLASLQRLWSLWPQLGCSVLLWLPRPWLHQVKRTVPALWQGCNAVFEFLGDPTPLSEVGPIPSAFARTVQQWPAPEGSPSPPDQEGTDSTDGRFSSPVENAPVFSEPSSEGMHPEGRITPEVMPPEDVGSLPETSLRLPTDLWHRLSADLSRLEKTDATATQTTTTLVERSTVAVESVAPAVDRRSLPETEPLPPAPQIPPVNVRREGAALGRIAVQNTPPQIPAAPPPGTTLLEAAHHWRDRIEAGDQSPETLATAIHLYEQLRSQGLEHAPYRTELLNDLGSLYWLQAQQADDPAVCERHLTDSREIYEAAIVTLDAATSSETRVRLYSNLGSVYSLLASHSGRMEHLSHAVRTFHRALQYTNPHELPGDYVTLQMHLGTAYWSLAQHTQEANSLHRAIAAYQEAIRQCQPHQSSETYAQLQNNLGIAYWSLARYERPEFLLEAAIAAYRSALAYRTVAIDPAGCAATHNNLGTAYWDLGCQQQKGSMEQRQNWQQAIAAYEKALEATNQAAPEALSFDLGATHHSVGVVYDQLADGLAGDVPAQKRHCQQALAHYVQALQGWYHEGSENLPTALGAIVQTLRHQAERFGLETQQQALSTIPAHWLPEIWRHL